jgi:hypothetical protein
MLKQLCLEFAIPKSMTKHKKCVKHMLDGIKTFRADE